MATVTHTVSFDIPRNVEALFHLFSPEGETLWVPGWTYENVMGTTPLHEDYVFLTKSHDHAASDAIWIVKAYAPENYRVQFYRVEPGEKVGVVTVQCCRLGEDSTRVEVTYTYIGLSPSGDAFITTFSEPRYRAFIAEWEVLLMQYLERKNVR